MSGRPATNVSDETRARIVETALSLGYTPDRSAQMLRLRKTWTIACALPDITNPFYPALERGVQDVALASGYDVLAINTDAVAEREQRLITWCRQGRVDGLIGVFFRLGPEHFLKIERSSTPAVCIGPKEVFPEASLIDSIFTDNRRAAAEATRYLLARDHRRIGMIGAVGGPGPERADGYVATVREAGLSAQVEIESGFTEQAGYAAAQRLIAGRDLPSALFCANDLMAAGAILALRETGVDVPGQVAVMGFDDIQLARLITPALTTVNQFQHELGRTAATMLLERLEAPAAHGMGRSREMPFEVVRRQSA